MIQERQQGAFIASCPAQVVDIPVTWEGTPPPKINVEPPKNGGLVQMSFLFNGADFQVISLWNFQGPMERFLAILS